MKAYAIDIPPQVIRYNTGIRQKNDIIRLLIGIISLLNVSNLPASLDNCSTTWDEKKIRLVLYVEKMSRVFICEKDKIHSFHFPFQLAADDHQAHVYFEGKQISSAICSVLSAVFEEMSEHENFGSILERYWEVSLDLEISEADNDLCCKLLTIFLSFEPGYLRFDQDLMNDRGNMHPRNHLDINYSSSATFKLGLSDVLDYLRFIDVLNINTPCAFLD